MPNRGHAPRPKRQARPRGPRTPTAPTARPNDENAVPFSPANSNSAQSAAASGTRPAFELDSDVASNSEADTPGTTTTQGQETREHLAPAEDIPSVVQAVTPGTTTGYRKPWQRLKVGSDGVISFLTWDMPAHIRPLLDSFIGVTSRGNERPMTGSHIVIKIARNIVETHIYGIIRSKDETGLIKEAGPNVGRLVSMPWKHPVHACLPVMTTDTNDSLREGRIDACPLEDTCHETVQTCTKQADYIVAVDVYGLTEDDWDDAFQRANAKEAYWVFNHYKTGTYSFAQYGIRSLKVTEALVEQHMDINDKKYRDMRPFIRSRNHCFTVSDRHYRADLVIQAGLYVGYCIKRVSSAGTSSLANSDFVAFWNSALRPVTTDPERNTFTILQYPVGERDVAAIHEIVQDVNSLYREGDDRLTLRAKWLSRKLGTYKCDHMPLFDHLDASISVALYQLTLRQARVLQEIGATVDQEMDALEAAQGWQSTLRRWIRWIKDLLSGSISRFAPDFFGDVYEIFELAILRVTTATTWVWDSIRGAVITVCNEITSWLNGFIRPLREAHPWVFAFLNKIKIYFAKVRDFLDRRLKWGPYENDETTMREGVNVTVQQQPEQDARTQPHIEQILPTYTTEQTVFCPADTIANECDSVNRRLSGISSSTSPAVQADLIAMRDQVLREHAWENSVEPMDFQNGWLDSTAPENEQFFDAAESDTSEEMTCTPSRPSTYFSSARNCSNMARPRASSHHGTTRSSASLGRTSRPWRRWSTSPNGAARAATPTPRRRSLPSCTAHSAIPSPSRPTTPSLTPMSRNSSSSILSTLSTQECAETLSYARCFGTNSQISAAQRMEDAILSEGQECLAMSIRPSGMVSSIISCGVLCSTAPAFARVFWLMATTVYASWKDQTLLRHYRLWRQLVNMDSTLNTTLDSIEGTFRSVLGCSFVRTPACATSVRLATYCARHHIQWVHLRGYRLDGVLDWYHTVNIYVTITFLSWVHSLCSGDEQPDRARLIRLINVTCTELRLSPQRNVLRQLERKVATTFIISLGCLLGGSVGLKRILMRVAVGLTLPCPLASLYIWLGVLIGIPGTLIEGLSLMPNGVGHFMRRVAATSVWKFWARYVHWWDAPLAQTGANIEESFPNMALSMLHLNRWENIPEVTTTEEGFLTITDLVPVTPTGQLLAWSRDRLRPLQNALHRARFRLKLQTTMHGNVMQRTRNKLFTWYCRFRGSR
nr:hypothetical protein [Dipluran tombus-related virus]